MAQSIDSLAPEDRITHYRVIAAEVQYLASEAQFEEVREQFLELARSWRSIADNMSQGLVERDHAPAPASQSRHAA
ncbi:MAG TPA: hypothetical protein VHT03_01185 [Rhizomicrobium sp.]|jgi:hypothetical protein|nr:hypothetical protein [Rhizomicrobium sp.]